MKVKTMLTAAGLVVLAWTGMASAQVPATTPPVATAAANPAGAPPQVAASAGAAPSASASPAATSVSAPAVKAPIPEFYAPTPGIGQPTDRIGLQPQVTSNGAYAAWFHDGLLLPIITVISLLVLALLLWVTVRYNRRANASPSRTSHNTTIEIIWTVAPVLVLLAIAVPSIKLLARQYSTPKPDLTVKVIGHQWYWSYQYPDNGDFEVVSNILTPEQDKAKGEPRQLGVDARMVVPAGAIVKVITTSDDVIHSFAVPAFWIKMDAVPGRLNETWFKVDRPGVYYGQCSELCGARHGYMPIAVEVVRPDQFAQWVKANGGTMGGKPKPAEVAANAGAAPASPTPSATGAAPAASVSPATATN